MNLSRRDFAKLLLTATAGLAGMPGIAAEQAAHEDDRWRTLSPPVPTDTSDKIEVIEFFSYACPHCQHLNPLLKDWGAKLSADTVLRRLPVTFGRRAWDTLSRLFFTLQDMGQLERLDQAVFNAIHSERERIFTATQAVDWATKHDIDANDFKKTFESFDVQTQVSRGNYLADKYRINAVPTLTVAGRYVLLNRAGTTQQQLLETASELITRVREDQTPT